MHKVFALGAAVLLFGCASRPERPAISQDQQDEAMRLAVACMKMERHQLDDGKSDAMTVGYAVMAACELEVNQAIAAYSTHLSPQAQNRFLVEERQDMLGTATQLVLMQRRQVPVMPSVQPQ